MSALETNAVPTPTTLSAFLAGLLLLGYTRRRMQWSEIDDGLNFHQL